MSKLIRFELRKIFTKRLTLIALVAVLLLSVLFSFSTYQNKYAFDGISNEGKGRVAVAIDKSIAAKYEGILTNEKVQQMMSDLVPKSNSQGLNAIYIYRNAMQSAVAARFSDINGNWNGLSVSDVFGEEEIKIGYVDSWLNTSQNIAKVFIMLSLVIIIMVAPVFSAEYGGVDNIILTSKYGKTKCATAKVIASIFAALIVTALVAAINILTAFLLYGRNGLDCSILFAPLSFVEGYIPFNITCGTLLKYQMILAFTSAISVTGVTLILSAVCKNQMVALVASAAVHVLPIMLPVAETNTLFRFIVLLPLYHSQFLSIMSIEQINGSMLYSIWAIPTSLVFLMIGFIASRKVFAKHQVS